MKNVMSFVSGLVVIALLAPPLAGQVTISAMADDLTSVTDSADVTVIRLGDFEEEPAKVGTVLNVGDEVRCISGKTSVELTCSNEASMSLSEPFRVVVLPRMSPHGPCWINLLKGDVQVVTEHPTNVTSGETTLGSERTRYGMRIARRDQELQTEISVYEGRVSVHRLGRGSSLEAGRKMVLRRVEQTIVALKAADFKHAAAVYAKIDTVRSRVASEAREARDKAYKELEAWYVHVLQKPLDRTGHRNLAVAQLNLQVPARALYSLNRAISPDSKPREAAVVDLLKGVAFEQLGAVTSAERFYERAAEKDPSAVKEATLKVLNIGPQLVRSLPGVIVRPSIIVEVSTQPPKVAPGRRAQIIVRARTRDDKPLRDANVVIQVEGGSFTRTGKKEISGSTDARGSFTAAWSPERRAGACVFNVEVSKQRLRKASSGLTVDIER
ncbi:MAG: hypothetical protein JSU70_01225 [Phycisphaerales bacterium]|nr:MAG: hypothetical protein JSU70_01225 [Phycisphaerales bacterium]